MIKNNKYFNFNKEEKPKHVKYHASKMSKYLKNVILATIFIFTLLLILINADFVRSDFYQKCATNQQDSKLFKSTTLGNSFSKQTINNITKEQSKVVTKKIMKREIKNLENWDINEKNSLLGNSSNKRQGQLKEDGFILETAATKPVLKSSENLTSAIFCQEYKENCTMICSNGSVVAINNNPELKNNCPNNDLNLKVAKCLFINGILQQSFFSMNFSLGFLSINECNLTTIRAEAFKHENVKRLHTLILTNNHLISLQANTFEGLTNLLHFELVQNLSCCIFEGEAFLKPMADNLKKTTLQPSKNSSEIMDPLNWWQELQLNSLTELDLSNTNLKGILKSSTFQPFVTLESLRLMNCNLFSINAEVFDFISSSFKYLDLRFNHLQTLDTKVLHRLTTAFVKIELGFNNWNCECDTEMMQYFTEQEVQIAGEILCSTPENNPQTEIRQAIEACKENKNTMITAPSANTTQNPNVVTSDASVTIAKNTSSTSSETTNEMSTVPSTVETNSTEAPLVGLSTLDKTITINISNTTDIPLVTKIPNVTPIKCFLDDIKTNAFWTYIAKPNANFSLYINSSTSLTIKLPDCKKFSVIYFANHRKFNYIDNLECSKMAKQSEFEVVVYIKNLIPSTVYLFCLVMETDLSTSPFDCRSQFMEVNKPTTVWLLQTDKVWFIAINSIAAVLLFVLTLFIVYRILRKIKISKFNNNAKRISRSFKGSLRTSPSSGRNSTYLRAYKNDNGNIIYASQHTIPASKAPILPILTTLNGKTNKSPSSDEKDCSQYADYLNVIN